MFIYLTSFEEFNLGLKSLQNFVELCCECFSYCCLLCITLSSLKNSMLIKLIQHKLFFKEFVCLVTHAHSKLIYILSPTQISYNLTSFFTILLFFIELCCCVSVKDNNFKVHRQKEEMR